MHTPKLRNRRDLEALAKTIPREREAFEVTPMSKPMNSIEQRAVSVMSKTFGSLHTWLYQKTDGKGWPLAARGQVDGIGSSPRFRAKNGQGREAELGPF